MTPLCSTVKFFFAVPVFGYKYACNEYRTGLFHTDTKFANWLYMCSSDMCILRDVANIPLECVKMK